MNPYIITYSNDGVFIGAFSSKEKAQKEIDEYILKFYRPKTEADRLWHKRQFTIEEVIIDRPLIIPIV